MDKETANAVKVIAVVSIAYSVKTLIAIAIRKHLRRQATIRRGEESRNYVIDLLTEMRDDFEAEHGDTMRKMMTQHEAHVARQEANPETTS